VGRGRPVTDRVAAGLGLVPRVVGPGLDIYASKLSAASVHERMNWLYAPYHAALANAVTALRDHFGFVILLDCHSMPAGVTQTIRGKRGPEVVLGDRNGASAAFPLTAWLRDAFAAHSLNVALNDPYSGGHTTMRYGRPSFGVHVVQIELARSLYMDEERIAQTAGFAQLHSTISAVLTLLTERLDALAPALHPATPKQLAAE
jgi:N-formylglutamate amidohydrolase